MINNNLLDQQVEIPIVRNMILTNSRQSNDKAQQDQTTTRLYLDLKVCMWPNASPDYTVVSCILYFPYFSILSAILLPFFQSLQNQMQHASKPNGCSHCGTSLLIKIFKKLRLFKKKSQKPAKNKTKKWIAFQMKYAMYISFHST